MTVYPQTAVACITTTNIKSLLTVTFIRDTIGPLIMVPMPHDIADTIPAEEYSTGMSVIQSLPGALCSPRLHEVALCSRFIAELCLK